jgi:hypothetical protein
MSMRTAACIVVLSCITSAHGQEIKLIAKPEAFPTLVNPNCSHCVDEARRRAGELKPEDPVLA